MLCTALVNGNANPVGNGVQYFAGSVQGNVNNYFNWDLTIDSADTAINNSTNRDYNTSVLTDLAEQWIADQNTPWFMVLAYQAPHTPVHLPDPSLHTRAYVSWDRVDEQVCVVLDKREP